MALSALLGWNGKKYLLLALESHACQLTWFMRGKRGQSFYRNGFFLMKVRSQFYRVLILYTKYGNHIGVKLIKGKGSKIKPCCLVSVVSNF